MRTTRLIRPNAADRFQCIGPACEDSCCHGWRIGVDQPAYEKYRSLPPSPLRTLLDAKVLRNKPQTPGDVPLPYAYIELEPELHCPMLTEGNLCQIQADLGADYLCTICATFPRQIQTIDGLEERPLTLSCPEAARLVLLDPLPLGHSQKGTHELTWDDAATKPQPLRNYFWAIRAFTVAAIQNRAYPLWQRMFLIGTFSRRLDAMVRGELDRTFPAFLRDFEAAVRSGSLRPAMETIPADLRLQLDMVLRLVHLDMNGATQGARFRQCLAGFTQGIGYQPDAAPEGPIARYRESYERYYVPFFHAHPYILENYLINLVFWEQFPFGADLPNMDAVPKVAKAFTHFALQFALIKGVLIGLAGFYKESFCADHVIQAVQTVTKQFEHNSAFLAAACAALTEQQLDNTRGVTMLLRN